MSILQEGQWPPMIARCSQIPTEFPTAPEFFPAPNIGETVVELVMQPYIVPASGGGGGGNNNDREWRDDDKEKEHIPYIRRR